MDISILQDTNKLSFLTVDIALALGIDSMSHFLDLKSMEVIHINAKQSFDATDTLEAIEAKPEQYLEIAPLGTDFAHQAMQQFVDEQIKNPSLQTDLKDVLEGEKPFTGFRYLLDEKEALLKEWYWFRDNCYKTKAKEWLAANGLIAD